MDIEQRAVTRILDRLVMCPRLLAQISSNDKTPFTDGHIDVYRSLGRKNSDWLGRVSVQVKGRTHSGHLRSFSISRTDLTGFRNDFGVLYFVVTVNPKTAKTKIYYTLLSPFRIESILASMDDGQKSISVPISKFPSAPAQIEPILGLALRTKRQNPSMGFGQSMYEKISSVTVHSAVDLDFDAPIVLDPAKLDIAVEVTTEEGMSIPLGGTLEVIPGRYIRSRREIRIQVGDVVFDECFTRQIDQNRIEVELAGGVTMTLLNSEDQRSTLFNLHLEGNLAEQLKAAEFFAALTTNPTIQIGDYSGDLNTGELTQADSLHSQLAYLRRLGSLFSRLDVDMRLIEVDALTDDEIRQLVYLHRGLVENQEMGNTSGEISRSLITIGPWHLMVLVLPGQTDGRWKYVDLFDPAAPHLYRISIDDPESGGIPVTVYDAVEPEHLPTILNLRLGTIVDAYDALSDQPNTLQIATERVLALIAAADSGAPRRAEFLSAALELNDWVIEQQGKLDRNLVNRWQILWRTKSLTTEDTSLIRQLKRRQSQACDETSMEFELACALLLNDLAEQRHLEALLAEDQLAKMSQWPIWGLHDESVRLEDDKPPS